MNEPVNRIVTLVYDAALKRSKRLFPDGTESEWETSPTHVLNVDYSHTGAREDSSRATEHGQPVVTFSYDAGGFRRIE